MQSSIRLFPVPILGTRQRFFSVSPVPILGKISIYTKGGSEHAGRKAATTSAPLRSSLPFHKKVKSSSEQHIRGIEGLMIELTAKPQNERHNLLKYQAMALKMSGQYPEFIQETTTRGT